MTTSALKGRVAVHDKQAKGTALYRLAWRNIWRQKRRTTLLVVVVAYATLSTVFFWGFIDGYTRSIISNQSRYMLAPALVTTPLYQDDADPENALPRLDFMAGLTNTPGVRAAAPRLEFFALLRSPYSSESGVVRGIDPTLEGAVSNIPQSIGAGRMLEARGEVVLGDSLAERLDVRLGERLALDVSAVAGAQAAGLIVVGLIDSGIAAVDQGTVLVHLENARTLTDVTTATGVALDVARGREEAVVASLRPNLPEGLGAYSILDLLGALRQEIEASNVQMIPIGLIFALAAALAVTSTMLVSVLERQREFGMMAAIGLAPPKLSRMVVIEAIVTTLVGYAVGLILGYALTWFFGTFNILGSVFATASESFADFGLSNEIYTLSRPIYALYAAASVVLAAIFALLIPARRVAKLNPVTAMRDE